MGLASRIVEGVINTRTGGDPSARLVLWLPDALSDNDVSVYRGLRRSDQGEVEFVSGYCDDHGGGDETARPLQGPDMVRVAAVILVGKVVQA